MRRRDVVGVSEATPVPRPWQRIGGLPHLVAWLLLIMAVVYLASRGVWRALDHQTDMTYEYSATLAWLRGLNPYDAETLRTIVREGGGPVIENAVGHPVYFPSALPLFLPIAWGSWADARSVALLANLGGTLFVAWGMTRLAGWRATDTRSLLMMAFFLALAPLHTAIAFGQTAPLVTAAIVGAVLLERVPRPGWAGVLYGLATAIKLSIGAPFLAYVVWRRRATTAVAGIAVLVALTLIAVTRMLGAGVTWLAPWLANLSWLTGPTGNGSPTLDNPERTSLINLEYLLHAISPGIEWAAPITLVLVGIAALATVWLIPAHRPGLELLALSLVAVLALLVTYHRYYDAVILAFPIAWAFRSLSTAQRSLGIGVLALCATYLLPVQTSLNDLAAGGSIPSWLVTHPLWASVVLTTHVWALVLMVPLLLWAARAGRAPVVTAPRALS